MDLMTKAQIEMLKIFDNHEINEYPKIYHNALSAIYEKYGEESFALDVLKSLGTNDNGFINLSVSMDPQGTPLPAVVKPRSKMIVSLLGKEFLELNS
ncbi:hypothetical protein [Apilactobacillus xinyiensis]|uniref:hypothetical protein n=1 Tax=Apilactobacillus xinyiensis TaxID=2841032 RepID=UPI001C7E0B84|nr:hypothetical protein [Apilactobacillus xinyiensis]